MPRKSIARKVGRIIKLDAAIAVPESLEKAAGVKLATKTQTGKTMIPRQKTVARLRFSRSIAIVVVTWLLMETPLIDLLAEHPNTYYRLPIKSVMARTVHRTLRAIHVLVAGAGFEPTTSGL